MPRSLNLNEILIQEAMAIDNSADLETIIETALREYVQRHQKLKIVELFGMIDYDDSYDYKAQRQIQ
jgi:Bacterial antitoxin of type II TA system, VapB